MQNKKILNFVEINMQKENIRKYRTQTKNLNKHTKGKINF